MNAPQKHTANSPTTLTLKAMTRDEAAILTKRLLGSYPSLTLHDPKTYIAALCALLCGYPLWAGENAVRSLARESKFIPTQAEIAEKLEAEVRVARYVDDWDKGAAYQALPPPPGPTVAERSAFIAKRRAELGPTFGIHDGRKRPPTREEGRQALIAEIGQEAFDALPDAGIPSDEWQKLRAPKQEGA